MGNMKKVNKGLGAVAAVALIAGGTSQVANAATNKGDLSNLKTEVIQKNKNVRTSMALDKSLLSVKDGIHNIDKEGLYEVSIKTLKENNNEPSMAGDYLEKVNYEIKGGNKFLIFSLDSIDWMKNISVTVDGKEITPTPTDIVKKKTNDSKGKEKGKIKFKVSSLDSKVMLHMNVVPMGNGRVAFRVIPQKDTLKIIKEYKKEVLNTPPILTVGQDLEVQEGKFINLMKGVTAQDKEDGDLTKNIKVESGKLDKKNPKAGTYEVTYSVTDSKGEKVTQKKRVIVKSAKTSSDKESVKVSLPKVDRTKLGKFYGTFNKYRISFPATTKKEHEEFEKYIQAINDTNNVTVNGIKYGNEELLDKVNSYHFGSLGLDLNPSAFKEGINTVTVKANGYNDMIIKIKKDGTFVSQEEKNKEGNVIKIEDRLPNHKPKLSIGETIEVQEGKAIDLMSGVSSHDDEDGDLTKNIKVELGKLDKENPKEGTYEVTYSVKDKNGETVTKNRIIIVKKAAKKVDGKWINVTTLPRVLNSQFGDFYGTVKYRVSFPNTTDEEFRKFEEYIKAINNTNYVTVNGIKYSNEGLVSEDNNYHFGTIGLDLNPSAFKEDINTIVVKANGYNDMIIKIKKDGTFISEEEIQVKNSDVAEPENQGKNKTKLPKAEKVEYGRNYSDVNRIRISFLSRSDEDWNGTKQYMSTVNKNGNVVVNGINYKRGSEDDKNGYSFGLVGLDLNSNSFKEGSNIVIIKADGYEDMTIKIKKEGENVSLEKSTSEGNNTKPEKPTSSENEDSTKEHWGEVNTLPKIVKSQYGEIYGRVEYEIDFEQNDNLQKYLNAATSDKTKEAQVFVNGVRYSKNFNFGFNEYYLSYMGGLELNDKSFTKDINTIILKVDGYNDMRIKIKKDGTLISQEESTLGTLKQDNIKIMIRKDLSITAGEKINLMEDVLAFTRGEDRVDLTDKVKIDAGKLDLKNPKAGTYEVKYFVTYNGETKTATRKVTIIEGNVSTSNLEDGVYTVGFKAYRYDIPENESMLGGFFDPKVRVDVKNGKINLTMLNTMYAFSLLDFRIESNGKYISAKGTYKGEANSQGDYQMQTYEIPISDLNTDHFGCVLVGMMGGVKNDIGDFDKYKKVRFVFNKTCVKGWNGFDKDKEVVDTDAEFNKALISAGFDKDGDGVVTDEEISKVKGIVTLSGKKIKDISRLRHLGKDVTELYLSGNNISTLPKGIFDGLTGLEKLYLSSNRITELPEGIFDKLTKLTEIALGQNYITKLPRGIFDKLINLKSLGFTDNNLQELPDGIFDKVTNLEGIYLYNNKIENIPVGIGKLKKLKTLAINKNKIEKVPEELADLNELTKLDLSNNFIKEIPNKLYKNLKNLKTFEVQDNQLTVIPENIKELLPNVVDFKFKLNKINKKPNVSNLNKNEFYPQKHVLNLQLTAKDGKLTWKQDLSALDIYVWETYMKDCSSIHEYNKKLNGKTSEEYLKEKSRDWIIKTEIQRKDSNGKYITIKEIVNENKKDDIESVYNDDNMKDGDEYRIIKLVNTVGGLERRVFSDIATTTAKYSDNTKPNVNSQTKQIKVMTLKEKSNESSMAGQYVDKTVKYTEKDGKKYFTVTLNRMDWMKNVAIEVGGKEVKAEKSINGSIGEFTFEVGNENEEVMMRMNVVPMGNARVAFRLVNEAIAPKDTEKPQNEEKPVINIEKPAVYEGKIGFDNKENKKNEKIAAKYVDMEQKINVEVKDKQVYMTIKLKGKQKDIKAIKVDGDKVKEFEVIGENVVKVNRLAVLNGVVKPKVKENKESTTIRFKIPNEKSKIEITMNDGTANKDETFTINLKQDTIKKVKDNSKPQVTPSTNTGTSHKHSHKHKKDSKTDNSEQVKENKEDKKDDTTTSKDTNVKEDGNNDTKPSNDVKDNNKKEDSSKDNKDTKKDKENNKDSNAGENKDSGDSEEKNIKDKKDSSKEVKIENKKDQNQNKVTSIEKSSSTNKTERKANKKSTEIKEKKLPQTGMPFGSGLLATIGSAISGLGIVLGRKNKKNKR